MHWGPKVRQPPLADSVPGHSGGRQGVDVAWASLANLTFSSKPMDGPTPCPHPDCPPITCPMAAALGPG